VLFSEKLKNYSKKPYFENEFLKYEGQKINSPEKYLPKKEFLEYHLDTIFNK
jgi:putative restriction endonuclease